tara:strand:- start:1026 stop:1979 length:954 start_codon:yes stop_codon:yes gene_type:complete
MSNAFDEAWSLLKELDSDQRNLLGRIMNTRQFKHQYDDDVMDAILSATIGGQLDDPTTSVKLPTAKTPTLFRAGPIGGNFFTPQRTTAEQYSNWQDYDEPGDINRFEMSVPFDDKSVLSVPEKYDWMNSQFKTDEDLNDRQRADIQRVADANDLTIEEAAKMMDGIWHPTYMGFGEQDAKPLKDAGFDFVNFNEYASAAYYPPTWSSALGSIDWGAKHELQGYEDQDELLGMLDGIASDIRQGTNMKDAPAGSMWGKHINVPQFTSWHIGDEDSRPEHLGLDRKGLSRNVWDRHHIKADYPTAQNAIVMGNRHLRGE